MWGWYAKNAPNPKTTLNKTYFRMVFVVIAKPSLYTKASTYDNSSD